ncbi:MAG: hypothetical protein ACKVH8_16105 [Pirellulales bacterium]|jgi:hypothetical protein
MKFCLTYAMSITCVIVSCSISLAVEPLNGEQTARGFWSTLAEGNVPELKKYYAEKVILKAGSELLKSRWELSPKADRLVDLSIDRDLLLSGYQKLIDAAGQERWTNLTSSIKLEKIRVSSVTKDGMPFEGAKQHDVMLSINAGPGDDRLIYLFRKSEENRWLLVVESTDY